MTSNDFSAIPPFLLQRAETDHIPPAAAGGMDDTAATRSVQMQDSVSKTDGPASSDAKADDIRSADPDAIDIDGIDLEDLAEFENPPVLDALSVIGDAETPTDPLAANPPAAGRIELSQSSLPAPTPTISIGAVTSGSIGTGGYSARDLDLFRALTGYRLDTRQAIWRAVDDAGGRAAIADRLFTTLAEEAFRLADRKRRPGALPRAVFGGLSSSGLANRDLTISDLAMTLSSIRRAAASIGLRGASAFLRLEQAIARLDETMARAMPAGAIATGGSHGDLSAP